MEEFMLLATRMRRMRALIMPPSIEDLIKMKWCPVFSSQTLLDVVSAQSARLINLLTFEERD
jgi:hypothetical protein